MALRAYRTHLDILPTTLASGTTYFALTNTGPRKLYVTGVDLVAGFFGIAEATRSVYNLARYSAALPAGGVVQGVIRADTKSPAPSGVNVRASPAGLLMAGTVVEEALAVFGVQNQLNANAALSLLWPTDRLQQFDALTLNSGEGLAISARLAVVLGSYVSGSIGWIEEI